MKQSLTKHAVQAKGHDDRTNIQNTCCSDAEVLEDVKYLIQNYPAEIEYTCAKCSKVIAYWAYGYFDPNF